MSTTRRLRGARFVALALSTLAFAMASGGGCTVIIDTHADQCVVDRDCAKLGLPICVRGVCSEDVDSGLSSDADAVSTEGGESCTSTQDCLALHVAYSICRPSTHTCASVTSQDCGLVVGEYTRDDALVVGAILPLLGAHESSGLAMRDALRVALASVPDGVPVGKTGAVRPVAIVLCNDADDPARAARHLVGDLDAPLIVGGVTPEVALAITSAFDATAPA
ncbi:MAG: ABC transporter substrate-binding protein, partial [Polyangiales bacterium]